MIKSVLKALEILELFCKGHNELSISEMAELTKLEKTSLCRISSTLAQKGYLKQNRKKGKYSLGTIFFEFSGVLKRNLELRDVAIPYLNELTRQVRESAVIGLWDGREGVITESFHIAPITDGPLKVIPDEGTSLPLHCTATGKIFLAEMSEQEIDSYYKNRLLNPFTENTIVDMNMLKDQLLKIRTEKVAYDYEEYSIGVKGVAACIRDYKNMLVGSLCVVGPSVRMTNRRMEELTQTVKNFSFKISKDLGY